METPERPTEPQEPYAWSVQSITGGRYAERLMFDETYARDCAARGDTVFPLYRATPLASADGDFDGQDEDGDGQGDVHEPAALSSPSPEEQ